MLIGLAVTVSAILAQSPAPAPSEVGVDMTTLYAPILSTGVVGIVLIMILFKLKLVPAWAYDEMGSTKDKEITRLDNQLIEIKKALTESQAVYTEQVIPTLTRVLDVERELLDLRRDEAAERRRRAPD